MPKIGDLVSKLQIKDKTFKNPEWWSTKHKLKRNLRENEEYIEKLNARTTLKINSGDDISSDTFIREMQASLDSPRYGELAPWNPIFNKSKNIIIFRKIPKTEITAEDLAEQTSSLENKILQNGLDIDA